jgi:hypothetical protein
MQSWFLILSNILFVILHQSKVDFLLSQKFILKSYIVAKLVFVSKEIFISKSYAKFLHFDESQT